ncbi:hypothetical protein FB565_007221 [Actinoplanes lutulentus]|uniref:Uncharacterized protein n=1 Tax=Actinoplanes lutulentus TaxID=1287878 RepID=A0A327Z9L5_9ACTN|nr:hypothetical protein [Actinoplanes lutulentus]MBB2947450.1 hypothetical protein [Actinoplanes lutulentus]RAK28057.1 hypothetical protein B0I29_121153 [Actinoplanes lutulentus]
MGIADQAVVRSGRRLDTSRWWEIAYHAPTALFWIVLTGLYAVVPAIVAGVLFLGVAAVCFVVVAAAEDYPRRQRGLAVACGILLAASLAIGLAL